MSYWNYVGRIFSGVKGFYNEINPATLTGAIDVIIVKQVDGTYLSSPFHIRFGKIGVLRARQKVVDITINGQPVDLQMKLADGGEAFFVQGIHSDDIEVPDYLATSPIPSSEDLIQQGLQDLKKQVQYSESGDVAPVSRSLELDLKGDSSPTESHQDDSHKQRRKRLIKKRSKSSPRTPNLENEDAMFEMDVSTDEEEKESVSFVRSASKHSVSEGERKKNDAWLDVETQIHPYSDPDFSPIASPVGSRPPTPKSDTEYEKQLHERSSQSFFRIEDETKWEWGELPKTADKTAKLLESINSQLDRKDSFSETPGKHMELDDSTGWKSREDNGVTSNIPSLCKTPYISGLPGLSDAKKIESSQLNKNNKSTSQKTVKEEGIYLEDLNLEDPEIASIYLSKSSHFQSIKDEDQESGRGVSLPQSPTSVDGSIGSPGVSFLESEVRHLGDVALSVCGGLSDPDGITLDKFMQKVVTYDDLCESPALISNPDLVVKILDKYYNWMTAAPMVLSRVCFHKDVTEPTVHSLVKEHMPKKEKKKSSFWFFGRKKSPDPEANAEATASNSTTSAPGVYVSPASDTESAKVGSDGISYTQSPPTSPATSASNSPEKQRLRNDSDSKRTDAIFIGSDGDEQLTVKDTSPPVREKFMKTLRLTSDQIEKMGLREGENEVQYSVTTQYQGTTRCTSHIYLWSHDDKIVVSDIDGTITKSDVLGQILPILGRDWSQSGVAKLFTNINKNSYKFLYLSARAIGQSKITKDLLKNVKQDGDLVLPTGPLLLSPTSLISAFHREVIEKKPQEFKIACLKDIRDLFPSTTNPFYAGFGNKQTDVSTYNALDIPSSRIFTINPKGELRYEHASAFLSSYSGMSDISDLFFPPVHKHPHLFISEYSSLKYWREPLPDISPSELEIVFLKPQDKKDKKEKK